MPGRAATFAICFIPGKNPPMPPVLHEFLNSSNIKSFK